MHHVIGYYLARARMADLRRRAAGDARAGSPGRGRGPVPMASEAAGWPARRAAAGGPGREN